MRKLAPGTWWVNGYSRKQAFMRQGGEDAFEVRRERRFSASGSAAGVLSLDAMRDIQRATWPAGARDQ